MPQTQTQPFAFNPEPPAPPQAPAWSPLKAWVILLGVGLFCLRGRWDPSLPGSPSYTSPAYFLNAALAVVFLPAFYHALRLLLPHAQSFCRWALGCAWLAAFLPFRWTGLSSFYQATGAGEIIGPPSLKAFAWLPEALDKGLRAMPYEIPFMLGLLLAGLWLLGKALPADYPSGGRRFWKALFALLVLSTWMHLSERSPYTYISLSQDGPVWYARNLCPGQQCLAEGDYFVFKAGEDIFKGLGVAPVGTMLLRRPLVLFLSAPFTYFINPWYIYLALNVGVWFLACVGLYLYGRPLWGQEIAKIAALLAACGPGFITYVSQPMTYTGGLAAVAITLGLFQLIFAEGAPLRHRFWLFGAVLGLTLLSYDHLALLIFFLAAGLLRRLPLLPYLASLALALAIYAGFNYLTVLLKLPVDSSNSAYATGTLSNLKAMVLGGQFKAMLAGLPGAWAIFKRSMLLAFFGLAPLLAVLGLFRRKPLAVLESLAVLLAAFAAIFALHLSGQRWMFCELAELPRLVFVAYPGLYLLAASGIVTLRGWAQGLFGPEGAGYTGLALVGAVFLLSNLDVFGYPHLYYYYQWPWGGSFSQPLEWWQSIGH